MLVACNACSSIWIHAKVLENRHRSLIAREVLLACLDSHTLHRWIDSSVLELCRTVISQIAALENIVLAQGHVLSSGPWNLLHLGWIILRCTTA